MILPTIRASLSREDAILLAELPSGGAPEARATVLAHLVGVAGYRTAASSDAAKRMGLDEVLASVADHFSGVRAALNRVS